MKFFGQVLPIDGYQAKLQTSLPHDYVQSLIHLYQPLVGVDAIQLYQTLLCEAPIFERLPHEPQTHHSLMNQLNMALDRIYEARLKLEAIGLLNTFKLTHETGDIFIYELNAPFSPAAFFKDTMLSELLFRHIGENKFALLKKFYTKKQTLEQGENITVSFHDVFTTYAPSSAIDLPALEREEVRQQGVPLEPLNFEQVKINLMQRNIPVNRVLTEQNKRMITQLYHLYNLEMYELEDALQWSLTEENEIDFKQFKAVCHDLFTSKYNASNVKLHLNVNKPTENNQKQVKQMSPEEKLIQHFEMITPRELLEDLSQGARASEQDLKAIRDVMLQQGLSIPVMNVLIHFTLLHTNMKLSKSYLEKVASHWSRMNLKTAKEAMNFAREQMKPKAQPQRNQTQTKGKSKEIIPDWFKNRHQYNEKVTAAPLSEQEKQKQKEMASILEKYSSRNK